MPRARRLGKYELLDRIGSGGVAEAWLARVAGVGRFEKLVVVKTLQRALAEDGELLAMFFEEARLSSTLSHPNVVSTFDFGEVEGTYFLAMEYVEGRTLRYVQEVLQPTGKLSPAMAVHVASQLCRGLEYAHGLKDPSTDRPLQVVHRDVSSQNVMLSFGGDVKILDFGIATFASRDFRTAAGIVRGKLRYMAPEQALGQKVDRRADLFSAAVVLWEMLHGPRFMPENKSDAEMLDWIARAEFPSPAPPLPQELRNVLEKSLQADPGRRPASCGELATALIRIGSQHWPEFTQVDLARAIEAQLGPEIRADRARVSALLADPGGRSEDTSLDLPTAAGGQLGRAEAIGPPPDTTEKRGPAKESTDTIDRPVAGSGLRRVTNPRATLPERTSLSATPPVPREPGGRELPQLRRSPAPVWIGMGAAALLLLVGGGLWALSGASPKSPVPEGSLVAVVPSATVAQVEPSPLARAVRPARLSVNVDHGWAEVWIDGRRVRSETPLIDYEVAPGNHQVMVTRDKWKASKAVSLLPGERLTVMLTLARP